MLLDPDPYFPNQYGSGSRTTHQIKADSDPGQTLRHKKLSFSMKNVQVLQVGNRSKNIPYEGTKSFLTGRKPGYFGEFPCKLDPDPHFPNTDPDPGPCKKINADPDPIYYRGRITSMLGMVQDM